MTITKKTKTFKMIYRPKTENTHFVFKYLIFETGINVTLSYYNMLKSPTHLAFRH